MLVCAYVCVDFGKSALNLRVNKHETVLVLKKNLIGCVDLMFMTLGGERTVELKCVYIREAPIRYLYLYGCQYFTEFYVGYL